MKKILLVILVFLIITLGLFIIKPKGNKFKNEYERLNGLENQNGKKYMKVSISSNNPIVYSNYDEIFKLLESGTGLIYFGFPECPWCRNAVPVLMKAAEETGIDKIYYLNNLKDRDIKSLKNGKIKTEQEGTSNYKKLIKKLGKNASVYDGLNDEKIKRLYFPTVVAIKKGKIISYIEGTVDSQSDPYIVLNKNQKKELQNKYIEAINSILSCDINAKEKC